MNTRLSTALRLSAWAILSASLASDATGTEFNDSGGVVHRPRVALVLSGGAARGAAHVGVLKVLEENRVPVDLVVGTSMGAIVGGLYASGLSPEEMDRILTSTDWNDLFTDRPARKYLSFRRKQEDLDSLIKIELGWKGRLTFPSSLVAGDKLMFYLRKLTLQTHRLTDFDALPIPFRAVATDVEDGERVVLAKGDLAEALRASMAIPGAFAPQEIEGRLLVDGFLTQNLPVSVAREWGADVIIAVDVGAPLYTRDELKSVLKFSGQTLAMMSRRNTKEQVALLRPKDILIQPSLGTIRGLNFDRATEAISVGSQAAWQKVDSLRRLSVSESDYAAWKTQQRRRLTETVRIDTVRVETNGRVPAKTIEQRFGIKLGEEVKVEELRRSLNRVYDIGAFDLIDFRLAETGGQNDLILRPHERATGRIRIRSGLKLFSDLDGDSDFNFLTSITATELNGLGAEWKSQVQFGRTTRVFSEWYQPLTYQRRVFVAPYGQFLQDRVEGTPADGLLLRAKFRRFEGGGDVGAQLGNVGELRIGPVWGSTKAYELRGITLPRGDTRITQAGARVRLAIDQLDNVDFPRSGYIGGLELYSSREELGAGLNYTRVSAGWHHAFSFGENTVVPGLQVGAKLGPDLPFYETFGLGGFLRLSGYPFEGLTDQYSGLARLICYRRMMRFNNPAIDAIYLGGSVETGGVWHRFNAIDAKGLILAGSIFAGAETLFGPLYFAYGHAEGGNHAIYFYLGRGF